jgi:hydroxyacylglutathione hydrolase
LTPLSVFPNSNVITQDPDAIFVLDTRKATEFTMGFVPGSISIGLEGRFAEWAGSLLPFDKKMVLVTEEGKEKESIIRLARVGFDKIEGYFCRADLKPGKRQAKEVDLIVDVEPDELLMDIPFDENLVGNGC